MRLPHTLSAIAALLPCLCLFEPASAAPIAAPDTTGSVWKATGTLVYDKFTLNGHVSDASPPFTLTFDFDIDRTTKRGTAKLVNGGNNSPFSLDLTLPCTIQRSNDPFVSCEGTHDEMRFAIVSRLVDNPSYMGWIYLDPNGSVGWQTSVVV